MLNFAVTIFGMRHPQELSDLLDNLEAVQRAKAGAKDSAEDPNPKPAEERFAALKAEIDAGDIAAQLKIATAAMSPISIFHIDQLPALMPAYAALQEGASTTGGFAERLAARESGLTDMDVIKTTAIWAVSCFAKYHPDVVVMMGLVPAE